jgi:SAM-dependent methyltransferase
MKIGDGAIFEQLGAKISGGVGIDPGIKNNRCVVNGKLIRGWFPHDLPDDSQFDAITMLAVLEHIPLADQSRLARDVARFLKPGGRLIVTVPSPAVDRILAMLKFMRLVDGMALEEHYGFQPQQTPQVFSNAGLQLLRRIRFQFGLNNLFVFENNRAVRSYRARAA